MANALYKKAKEGFLDGVIDMNSDIIKVCVVKNTYTVNLDTHKFLSDIDESHVAGTSIALSRTEVTDGIFDADDITIENISNSGFSYIILYKDTGTRSTSRLIAYIDTADGLPVAPTVSSTTITISWSNTLSKIFAI